MLVQMFFDYTAYHYANIVYLNPVVTSIFFTSLNNTIIKMGIPLFHWPIDFISMCVSRYGNIGSYGSSLFPFLSFSVLFLTVILFPQMATVVQAPPFSHLQQCIVLFVVLIRAFLTGVRWYLSMGLIHVFLIQCFFKNTIKYLYTLISITF